MQPPNLIIFWALHFEFIVVYITMVVVPAYDLRIFFTQFAIQFFFSKIVGCIDRDSQKVIKALANQVKALKNPPLSREKVLDNLENNGLVRSVAKLKSLLLITG